VFFFFFKSTKINQLNLMERRIVRDIRKTREETEQLRGKTVIALHRSPGNLGGFT